MRRFTSSFFLLAVLSVAFVLLSHESTAAEKPDPELPKVYPSPGAVFEAYREAREKQDYRTVFFCLTPESREPAVFEAWFAANMHLNQPKMLAVLEKFGVEEKVINAEYFKCFREKHGVDIDKLIAEHEKAHKKAPKSPEKEKTATPPGIAVPSPFPEGRQVDPGPPLPPTDQDLLRKVLLARISDKAGFFAAVENVLANREWDSNFSKLENLTIQGNTATGCAHTVIFCLTAAPGKQEKKVGSVVKEAFNFRKWKGSWLIHMGEENWTPGTTPVRVEKTTTFEGKAADAKPGAVVVGKDFVVYIAGLLRWPDDFVGKNVSVTGVLSVEKMIPDPSSGSKVSQGASGKQTVIKNAQFERDFSDQK